MKCSIDCGGETGLIIELDLGPNTPPLKTVTVGFQVSTEQELRDAIEVLGFDVERLNVSNRLQTRYGLKVLADGEKIADANMQLWLGPELAKQPMDDPPIPVLAALIDEAAFIKESQQHADV